MFFFQILHFTLFSKVLAKSEFLGHSMKYLKMTKLKASGFILNLIRKMQNGAFAENSIKVVQKMPTLNYLHLLFLEK